MFFGFLFVTLVLVTVGLSPVVAAQQVSQETGYATQTIDLDAESNRQIVVDRVGGEYLGHPTTCLLEDGKTIWCVYPKGHGKGAIVMKVSRDGGLTWSERLPTPDNWQTSKETPTLHRVIGPDGKRRMVVFSGLYPIRMAVSENDGESWGPLENVGDWGGIVAMASVFDLRTGPGHYLAMFHDDGRFFSATSTPKSPPEFVLLKTKSEDGGMTWSTPTAILKGQSMHLCEPGVIRSPDGRRLACLLRENSRQSPSQIIFSTDEGETWTAPQGLPAELCGDRHVAKFAPDGRLLISFRRVAIQGQTKTFDGDWVAWVGTFDDLTNNKTGQYLVRLKDNLKNRDCAYPGVEVLKDGTMVLTTYGHWVANEEPYILSVRIRLAELDTRNK
jgi:hypothetical protein